MTDQELITAVAKLDGWNFVRIKKGPYNSSGYRVWLNSVEKGGFDDFQGFESAWKIFHIPQYLASYDAILPVIQKHTDQTVKVKFLNSLRESFQKKVVSDFDLITATPRQLAIALVRATSKGN